MACVLQVHLDHKHMGLGGDDSWSPCVHEQYLVPPTRSLLHEALPSAAFVVVS